MKNENLRPIRSDTKPKEAYPRNAPIWVGIIHPVDFTILMPAPPWSTGLARNAGIQVISPQYPNITAEVTPVASNVRLMRVRRAAESDRRALRSSRVWLLAHTSGSCTPFRIQNTSRAGSTPAANNQRHPRVGKTAAAVIAARM